MTWLEKILELQQREISQRRCRLCSRAGVSLSWLLTGLLSRGLQRDVLLTNESLRLRLKPDYQYYHDKGLPLCAVWWQLRRSNQRSPHNTTWLCVLHGSHQRNGDKNGKRILNQTHKLEADPKRFNISNRCNNFDGLTERNKQSLVLLSMRCVLYRFPCTVCLRRHFNLITSVRSAGQNISKAELIDIEKQK